VATRIVLVLVGLVAATAWASADVRLDLHRVDATDAIEAVVSGTTLDELIRSRGRQHVALPLNDSEVVELALDPFEVTTPDCRWQVGGIDQLASLPRIVYLRGHIPGEVGSRAYLSLSEHGAVRGYVSRTSGETYYLGTAAPVSVAAGIRIRIQRGPALSELPDVASMCGVQAEQVQSLDAASLAAADTAAGPYLARVALDTDQGFYQLFGDVTDAQTYMLQLMGVVSDIYIRDVGLHLVVDFLRLWPAGGEPVSADDLSGFADWWTNNEDMTGLHYVHLLSGRRGLPYGGVAYVVSPCSGAGFGISGYLNGSYSDPLEHSSIANWDIIVVAHEMGHNSGTFHTHDGFTPTLDDCGNGTPARGTIMSYCHIFAGYTSNIDLRFHGLVQEVIENTYLADGCLEFDCNLNGIADAEDILQGTSVDTNADGVPDECQDCDRNGVLDPLDIAGGAPDVNGNGIPDGCEADCNGNGLPDHYETSHALIPDVNANHIPDACEADCDGNAQADFLDIALGVHTDYDRNTVPDDCQDCNGNLVSDWIDLERQHNLFVLDLGDFVREYHARSGVPITNVSGVLNDPYDAEFGSDRLLYVASFGNNSVVLVDPDAGVATTFVASGSGGLTGAAGIAFGPDGHLYVSSQTTDRVLRFDGSTGASLGTFVTPGSGGLSEPCGLVFGDQGNLFVTSAGDHSVKEYDGQTGAFVGSFVVPGAGGLTGPRDLVFKPGGNLLVTSYSTDQVLEYDGNTGAFVRVFHDNVIPTSPWGIEVGPNGNVYVVRHQGTIRILEYDAVTGRYYRSFVRGDAGLVSPTGLAFRPASPLDCNQNGQLDSCDIAQGISLDTDADGIPDECGICVDSDGDGFGDPGSSGGVCPDDNCPDVFNPDQIDTDADGVGDSCDVCSGFSDLVDSDSDGVPDGCDICAGFDDAADADADGVPDGCDACPGFDDAVDTDADGVPDGCDQCAGFDDAIDGDIDGVPDDCDNCPADPNSTQADYDEDGDGDPCDDCPAIDVPGGATLLPGDANEDGILTSADIIYMVVHVFKGGPAPMPVADVGDADCSGDLTSADIIVLVNHVFKSGPAPCDVCTLP